MFQESNANSAIRIGTSDTIGSQLTPFLIGEFREHSGNSNQNILISNTFDVLQGINQYELDLGLIEGPVNDPQIISKEWGGDTMHFICPIGHPLASQPECRLKDLDNQAWILREAGS